MKAASQNTLTLAIAALERARDANNQDTKAKDWVYVLHPSSLTVGEA